MGGEFCIAQIRAIKDLTQRITLSKMECVKAYKFKMKPSKKMEAILEQWLNGCRELYNAALQERRDAWAMNQVSVNFYIQCRQLPPIKKIREDISEINAQVLQEVLHRVAKTFDAFFRRCKEGEKPGYPRFKGRDRYDSFTFPQMKGTFRLEGNKLHLSKIGSCRIRLSHEIEGLLKTCTVKREVDGWYVIFAVENDHKPPLPKTGEVTGIDLGLENLATLSNGERIENPRFFKKAEDKLADAQRRLSTKKLRSNRRKKAKKIVGKAHQKIRNQRNDYAHKLSNDLLSRFDLIAIENLNVLGMIQNGDYAKSISDAGWTNFVNILSNKAVEAGREIIKVNPAYTSQDCSACGHREKKSIRVRKHVCAKCGFTAHRDHNAALNIMGRAVPRVTTESPTIPRSGG